MVKMRAITVGGGGDAAGRTVVHLVTEPDPENENAPSGNAMVVFNDADDAKAAGLEEGAVYEVSLHKVSGAADDPYTAAVQAAKAIPNATNTRGYKTPPHLKVPPPQVPDGVVTLPRPSVVMEPVSDTPPDAGVTSPGPSSAQEAAREGQAAQPQNQSRSSRNS